MLADQVVTWGEAHLTDPATAQAISSAEIHLGHWLPEQLRELLIETNGIVGEHGLGLLWSIERIAADNALLRSSTDIAELYMPFDGLVFFGDAGNGDQFFMSLRGNNEIYRWDHEDDSRTWVAPTVLAHLRGWMRGRL